MLYLNRHPFTKIVLVLAALPFAGLAVAQRPTKNLAAVSNQAGEWNRWRGPSLDGISNEKGLLKEWPSAGPPLAWRSKGLGAGFASLAIAGNQIYTLGTPDGKSSMLCLNRDDGNVLWKTALGSGEPNCTPTIDEDRVYALSRNGVLGCVKATTGELLWSKNFVSEFGGREPTWGYSESPLIDGDLLIATPGSSEAHLVALDKMTGEVRWKTALEPKRQLRGHGGAGYASPVISNARGVKQYVTLTGNGLVSVNPTTGVLLWGYDKISNGTANIPTPLVYENYVLGSSGYGDGGTALLEVNKKGSTLSVDEVYYLDSKTLQNHHGGMILLDGFVYMGHGHNNGFPICFNLKSGKPNWKPGRGPGKESAAVAYADGHLYFRYQDATMALIEAKPDQYRLKGSFKLATHNRESWPHPVIAGGLLYVRDQDELLVYDVRMR